MEVRGRYDKAADPERVRGYIEKQWAKQAAKQTEPAAAGRVPSAIDVRGRNDKAADLEKLRGYVKEAEQIPVPENLLPNGLITPFWLAQKHILRTGQNAYDWLRKENNEAKKDPVQDFMTRYQESLDRDLEKLQQAADEKIGDSKYKKYLYDTYQAIGQVVKDLPLLPLSGGQAMTAKGIDAAKASRPFLLKFSDHVLGMIKTPVFMERAAEEYGRTYEEWIADGFSEEKAHDGAITMAIVMPALEMLGGSDLVAKMAGKGWKSILSSLIVGGESEAGEELLQDPVPGLLKSLYGKDVPLFSTENQDAIINPLRAGYSASIGGIVGGMGGAATGGINNALSGIEAKPQIVLPTATSPAYMLYADGRKVELPGLGQKAAPMIPPARSGAEAAAGEGKSGGGGKASGAAFTGIVPIKTATGWRLPTWEETDGRSGRRMRRLRRSGAAMVWAWTIRRWRWRRSWRRRRGGGWNFSTAATETSMVTSKMA